MVRVSADAFLAKVTELYAEQAAAGKGSVALACKSVPAKKIARGAAPDDRVLLFRVRKYGNNRHKKKFSTTITAAGHAHFHAALSHIVKAKVDLAALKEAALAPGAARAAKVSKKAAV